MRRRISSGLRVLDAGGDAPAVAEGIFELAAQVVIESDAASGTSAIMSPIAIFVTFAAAAVPALVGGGEPGDVDAVNPVSRTRSGAGTRSLPMQCRRRGRRARRICDPA
jgi:hypothetical protein